MRMVLLCGSYYPCLSGILLISLKLSQDFYLYRSWFTLLMAFWYAVFFICHLLLLCVFSFARPTVVGRVGINLAAR